MDGAPDASDVAVYALAEVNECTMSRRRLRRAYATLFVVALVAHRLVVRGKKVLLREI